MGNPFQNGIALSEFGDVRKRPYVVIVFAQDVDRTAAVGLRTLQSREQAVVFSPTREYQVHKVMGHGFHQRAVQGQVSLPETLHGKCRSAVQRMQLDWSPRRKMLSGLRHLEIL